MTKPTSRLDPHLNILGRGPSPQDLHRIWAFPQSAPKCFPLPLSGGQAVIIFSYQKEKRAVIPAAVYLRDGTQLPIPKSGLTESSRKDLPFLYEINAVKTLRSVSDMIDLAQAWVRDCVDQAPRQRG